MSWARLLGHEEVSWQARHAPEAEIHAGDRAYGRRCRARRRLQGAGHAAGIERALKKLDELRPTLSGGRTARRPQSCSLPANWRCRSGHRRACSAPTNEKKNFGIVWDGDLYTLDSWVVLKGSPTTIRQCSSLPSPAGRKIRSSCPRRSRSASRTRTRPRRPSPRICRPRRTRQHQECGSTLSSEFWVEYTDRLTQRFNKWAAK